MWFYPCRRAELAETLTQLGPSGGLWGCKPAEWLRTPLPLCVVGPPAPIRLGGAASPPVCSAQDSPEILDRPTGSEIPRIPTGRKQAGEGKGKDTARGCSEGGEGAGGVSEGEGGEGVGVSRGVEGGVGVQGGVDEEEQGVRGGRSPSPPQGIVQPGDRVEGGARSRPAKMRF